MSKCISSHGEYSEHEGNSEYCDWCGDCNHEAIRRNAKTDALRDAAERLRAGNLMIGPNYIDPSEAADWLEHRADRLEGDDE